MKTNSFLNGVGWSGWNDVVMGASSGSFSSPPAAVSRIPVGSPAVFARQAKGDIWSNYWHASHPSMELFPGASLANGPAAAIRSTGELSVFAVGTLSSQNLMAYVEFDPDPTSQFPWSTLAYLQGKVVADSPTAMVSRGSDRIDVFALGTDSKLGKGTDRAMLWTYANTLVPPSHTPGWNPQTVHPWMSLGGVFPVGAAGPAVASWDPNRLDVFAVGLDYAMYHKSADGLNITDTNSWQPEYPKWSNLGGTFGSGPAVASCGPNRLDVFALSTDDMMYQKSWEGTHWSGWSKIGTKETFQSAPAVASWGPARLDLFALGFDGFIYHNYSSNGTKWAGWLSIGNVQFVPHF